MKVKLYMCGGERPVSRYPLGIGYLISNCTKEGIEIECVLSPKELTDCDLIGLSSTANGTAEAIEILENTNIPVVIGGQVTLWRGLEQYPFKHIVMGEGELAFSAILNNSSAPRILKNIFIDDVDTIKSPELGGGASWIPILTSRGCPFSCNFCSSQLYWGKVRMHSPEYIINEIQYQASKLPRTRGLYFLDDLFGISEKRVAAIHELWMKNELHKRFDAVRGFIRSDTFTKPMGLMMKEMGFQEVRFGAESGSERMLKLLNKRATVEDHQKTIDIGAEIGMPVGASFMHHLPDETEEDTRLTNEFINRNRGKLRIRGWYHYKPFPGTKMSDDVNPLEMDMTVR